MRRCDPHYGGEGGYVFKEVRLITAIQSDLRAPNLQCTPGPGVTEELGSLGACASRSSGTQSSLTAVLRRDPASGLEMRAR